MWTTPHTYFLVVSPELVHVKSRNTEDRAYQNCLQTIMFTTFPAALPTWHFSAQNVPEQPRLGKLVGKVKKAQATSFAHSSPYGQHLCVCLSSLSPCPEILRLSAHGSGGTSWMGTAEKAQPTSECGTNADCPEKILLVQISESMFPSSVNKQWVIGCHMGENEITKDV